MAAQPHGRAQIEVAECKGCGLCIESCPTKCLEFAPELSAYGVHPARYTGRDCTGCGICFYCCPEPGAITSYRLATPRNVVISHEVMRDGGAHAAAL